MKNISKGTKNGNIQYVGQLSEYDYNRMMTEMWNEKAPETKQYEICSMEEATHVIFTEMDLALAGEEGKNFTPYKIYKIGVELESGDYFISDDFNNVIIGFEMFMPCEFLRKKGETNHMQNEPVLYRPDNVIYIDEYLRRKRRRER